MHKKCENLGGTMTFIPDCIIELDYTVWKRYDFQ